MNSVARFLYAAHPLNKYDPAKLYEIWAAKIKDRDKRDNEMSKLLITDFLKTTDEINENYNILNKHLMRLKESIENFRK
jgi:hypothetical protein